MDFYEKVITQCREKGVSRSKMADDIGISRSTPKDWESGKTTPRFDTIKKLADYFGVPVSYFSDTANDDISGVEYKLSDQAIELLNIFEQLTIVDQAKLIVYAEELKNRSEK